MSVVRRCLIVVVVAVALALAGESAALAKTRYSLSAEPASPTTAQPVTLTLRAPELRPGTRYEAFFGALPDATVTCNPGPGVYLKMHRTGSGTFTVTVRPKGANGTIKTTRWCPGATKAGVVRAGPGLLRTRPLVRHKLKVRVAPGQTPEPGGVPVKTTLLPGSTLTATVPERPVQPTGPAHPDRSTPLTGTLRARIPGRFSPNADINTIDFRGAITPASFAPDPLCPGTAPPPAFATASSSTMELAITGVVTWNLVLNGGASQLFGCGPAGPLAGTTSIQLRGTSGAKGLVELALTGSVPDIALPDGSKGRLTANLLVNIDLSGKP